MNEVSLHNSPSLLTRTLLASVILLSLASTVYGQISAGSIQGTVKDPSGAVVSGATVTIVKIDTQFTRNETTNANGLFSFNALSIGEYRLTVQARGFSIFSESFELLVGSHLDQEIGLSVGSEATTVEVTSGGSAAVNTVNQEVSSVVNSAEIAEFPTLTRDPYDLVATAGNAQQDSQAGLGDSRGVGYSLNGQRSASTNIMLDGADNVNEFDTSVGQTVPLDSVEEFRVVTNGMTAEYGRASGGVVNVATKAGSNAFHGTAYEYNRVSALATNTFNNAAFGEPRGGFTRNQFGFSVGGPVVKNKLFFFENSEWIRVRSSAPQTAAVPDPALIAASAPATQTFFSQLGTLRPGLSVLGSPITVTQLFADGITPGPLLTAYGGPNCSAADSYANCPAPAFDNVTWNAATDDGAQAPQNTLETVARVDYNLSDKTQLFARYSYYGESDFAGYVNTSPYSGYDTGQTYRDNAFLLSLTHSFTNNVLTNVRLVFTRLNNLQPLGTRPAVPSLNISLSSIGSIGGTSVAFPGIGGGGGLPFGGPQNLAQFYDDVSWVHRKHTFRFGGQYIYTQDNRAFGAYEEPEEALASESGGYTEAFDNFLAGQIDSFQGAINPQGVYPGGTVTLPVGPPSFSRSNIYNDLAFYGQDTWKVTSRLTLDLGLRWEYYGVQHNKNANLDSNFYPASGDNIFENIALGTVQVAPKSPIGGLWAPQKHNFGPRIGFAYDLFGNGKTSLRGGYGIAYERNFNNVTYNVIQNPPAQGVVSVQAANLGLPFLPIYTSIAGPLSGSTGTVTLPPVELRYLDNHIKTAYTEQWNLGFERELDRNLVFDLGYSGARGIHQYSISNINDSYFAPEYLGTDNAPYTLNTQYTNINKRGSEGDSYYHALVATVRGKLKFATLNANYTWSHSIDTLSSTFSDEVATNGLGYTDPFSPATDRGTSDYDARHRIALSAVVPLPFYKNSSNKALQETAGGWQFAPIFTYHTGNPFTLYDCEYSQAYYNCPRAEVVPGSVVPKSGSAGQYDGNNLFDYLTVPASTPSSPDGGAYEYAGPTLIPGTTTPFPVQDSALPTCTGLGHQGCSYPSNMLGRNSFVGPGNWNLNFGAYKEFQVTERTKLQFRSEFYDLTNHKNFYVYGFGFGGADAPFQPTNPEGYPIVQAKKGGFGNSFDDHRNIQFALKLIF
ncbi:MAG: carboxypeptidase regulatory-like domain-containing protein [Terriglobales bacterium]